MSSDPFGVLASLRAAPRVPVSGTSRDDPFGVLAGLRSGVPELPPTPADLSAAFHAGQLPNPTPEQIDAIRTHDRTTPVDWAAVPGKALDAGVGAVVAAGQEIGQHLSSPPPGRQQAPLAIPGAAMPTYLPDVAPVATVLEAPVRATIGLLDPVYRGLKANADAVGALAQAPSGSVWPAVKAAAGEAVGQASQGNVLNALGAATVGALPAVARNASPELDREQWLERQQAAQQTAKALEGPLVPGALPRTADVLSFVSPTALGAVGKIAAIGKAARAVGLEAYSARAERLAEQLDASTAKLKELTAAGASEALDKARESHRLLQQRFLDVVDRLDKAVPEPAAGGVDAAVAGVAQEAGRTGGALKGAVSGAGEAAVRAGEFGERVTEPAMEAMEKVAGVAHGKGGAIGALGLASLVPHHVVAGIGSVVGALSSARLASKLVTNYGRLLQRLGSADWNASTRVWEQLAKDPDAPNWLKLAAKSPVGRVAEAAAREGGAVAKSGAEGTAFGAALSQANPDASPEEREGAVALGAGLGTAIGASARVLGRGQIRRAAYAHDMAVAAHEAIQAGQDPVAVLSANPTALLYGVQLRRMFQGALPGGKDLKVEFLDQPHFDAAVRELNPGALENTGVALYDPASNRALINLNNHDADARLIHEALGHALWQSAVVSRPDVIQQLGEALARSGSTFAEAERQYATALHPGATDEQLQQVIARARQEALTQYGSADAWVAGELLAEASARAVGGQDLAALASPSGLRRATAGTVGGFRSSFFVGKVLGALDDPQTVEYVRAGLRKLGEFTPGRDTPAEQAVNVGPETWGKHPGANPRTEQGGNDFFAASPDGALRPRKPEEVRRIIVGRRREMNAMLPLDGPVAAPGDADPAVKLRRNEAGRVERTGTQMPPGFFASRSFGEHTKQFAKQIQTAIAGGETLSAWYQAIGHGPEWKAHVARDTGAIEAQHYDLVPYGFLIDKQGNALVRAYSLTAFEKKAQQWALREKGPLSLELWGNDLGAFREDVKTYLADHAAGVPAATHLGEAKRNLINVFLAGRANKANEDRNPLRTQAVGEDRNGIIRSFRLDRLETVDPSDVQGFSRPDYSKQAANFSPEVAEGFARAKSRLEEKFPGAFWGGQTAAPVKVRDTFRKEKEKAPDALKPGTFVVYGGAGPLLVDNVWPHPDDKTRRIVRLMDENGKWQDVAADAEAPFGYPVRRLAGYTPRQANLPQGAGGLGMERAKAASGDGAAVPPASPSDPYPPYSAWSNALPKGEAAAMDRAAAANKGLHRTGVSWSAETKEPERLPGGAVRLPQGAVAPPQYSARTWEATDKVKLLQDLVKAGHPRAQVTKWIRDTDNVAAKILEHPDELDYRASSVFKAVKDNADDYYGLSVDFSTLCRKSAKFLSTIGAVMVRAQRGLTSEQMWRVRDMLREAGEEIPCAVCYVNSRKIQIGESLDNLRKEFPDVPADLIYDPYRSGELKERFPAAYDWLLARGTAVGKAFETRAEYNREILELPEPFVRRANLVSGMRKQSWSDFEAPHLIDTMQVTHDFALRGLAAHSYTKVPEYVELVSPTGEMVNMSLIPKGAGIDNGRLLFDDIEGMPSSAAFALRERFPNNAGTILVGATDAHIIQAMQDPRIDYIIPYHASGLAKQLRNQSGSDLRGWKDYTKPQHEGVADPALFKRYKAWKKEQGMLADQEEIRPWEYWDPEVDGDANAQRYLQWAKSNGVAPKFQAFSHLPGYWKLLVDRRMYNDKGEYIEQFPVKPNFDMAFVTSLLDREIRGTGVGTGTATPHDGVVARALQEFGLAPQYSPATSPRSPESPLSELPRTGDLVHSSHDSDAKTTSAVPGGSGVGGPTDDGGRSLLGNDRQVRVQVDEGKQPRDGRSVAEVLQAITSRGFTQDSQYARDLDLVNDLDLQVAELQKYAAANGLERTAASLRTKRRLRVGSEHEVFRTDDLRRVVRITHPGKYADPRWTPEIYLRQLDMLNQIFPDLDVRVEGLVPDPKGLRIASSGAYIQGQHPASEVTLAKLLAERGWEEAPGETAAYRHTGTGVVIFDAHAGNFVVSKQGKLCPIDVHVDPSGASLSPLFSPSTGDLPAYSTGVFDLAPALSEAGRSPTTGGTHRIGPLLYASVDAIDKLPPPARRAVRAAVAQHEVDLDDWDVAKYHAGSKYVELIRAPGDDGRGQIATIKPDGTVTERTGGDPVYRAKKMWTQDGSVQAPEATSP